MLQSIKPQSQLIIVVGLVLICLIVFSFLSLIGSKLFFGIDMLKNPDISNNLGNAMLINALKFMQTIQAIGVFIIPSFLFLFFAKDKPKNILGLNNFPSFNVLLLSIICVICLSPFINLLAELNSKIPFPKWVYNSEEEAGAITKAFLNVDSYLGLFMNLFIMAILPGVGEELLFRGVLQNILNDILKKHHLAIWLTAILFSAMHMQFLGFFPRVLLGAMFGYFYFWSGSIWISMIGHFINNAMAVIIGYLISKNKIDTNIESIGINENEIWIVAIGFAASMLCVYSIRKYLNAQNTSNE